MIVSLLSYFRRTIGQTASADVLAAQRLDIDGVELGAIDAVDVDDRILERIQVAIFRIDFLPGVGVDRAVEQLFGEGHQVLAGVDRFFFGDVNPALEQLAAQRVDALALLVHDVVVLEEVFADGEVLRFDLLLRARDGVGDHLVLDGNAFFHPEALHQTRDPVRAEDAHQVVFEREVEARRSGIALAAGASSQLVVDAAGFVAFGGDDVQPTEVHHVIVLGVGLLLERLEDSFVGESRHAIEMIEMVEVDELVVVDELLLALRQFFGDFVGKGLLPRHEFRVAAEQDVGAAAGHVRGDGDGALAARLGDDLGFLGVILRVEDDVS